MSVFWLKFEKKKKKRNCPFRNQYPQIFQYAKFHAKKTYSVHKV